jgi:hypothetical protein
MATKRNTDKSSNTPSKKPRVEPGECQAAAREETQNQADTDDQDKKSSEHFVRGILTRGEAAEAPEGKLPPGATHEIVEKDEQGQPKKIVRRRFSLS